MYGIAEAGDVWRMDIHGDTEQATDDEVVLVERRLILCACDPSTFHGVYDTKPGARRDERDRSRDQ